MWILFFPLALVVLAMSSTGRNTSKRAARVNGNDNCPGFANPPLAKELAAKWGKVFGVPAAFIIATMEHESSLNPTCVNMAAVSNGGAWGLMQLLYAGAAKDMVDSLKASSNPLVKATLEKWSGMPKDLLDPDLNVMLGTRYLQVLLKKFGSDKQHVAAAYNKGPGLVERLLHQDGDLRNLPSDGREYVAKADALYRKYA